ncbi:MAG: hypothetical protein ACWIPH_06115 [Ostreibacterium sp.]
MMTSVELTPEVLMAIKDELAYATTAILPGINLDVVAILYISITGDW